MPRTFLLQISLLLIAAQMLLGLFGFAVNTAPWVGLPILLVLGWMIVHIGSSLQGELEQMQRAGRPVAPWRISLLVALVWQVPTLFAITPWAPPWVNQAWHGAILPLSGLLGVGMVSWVYWVASLVEAGVMISAGAVPPAGTGPRVSGSGRAA